MITVVRRKNADYFIDIIKDFQSNLQIDFIGSGTTEATLFSDEIDNKSVICSIITEDRTNDVLKLLKQKFDEYIEGKGIAFTIPFSSVIGVSFYNFLTNNTGSII